MIYSESFPIKFQGVADPEAMVLVPGLRITVLTSRLLRLELSPTDTFEDRPSQAFWYRRQAVPQFMHGWQDGRFELQTEYLRLHYHPNGDGKAIDALTITLKENGEEWQVGQEDGRNLLGTARTLDDVDGMLVLEEGLLSRSGWAVYDDSRRLLFTEKGWLSSRSPDTAYRDLYFFGYGRDYTACLQDFSRISGPAPPLPRWALGNWWSRYWAYTGDELLALMDDFKAHEIPLAVCIVDMDWHITDTGNQCSGWTGYTWNKELFPDPPAFIEALHQQGLKTAMNLHPAEGIHPHEAQYVDLALALGLDPQTEEPIPFNIADPDFTKAYFELLHHPYERDGVDFWWMDWQQGTLSDLPGLDPLWWLNHLHYHDLAREGEKRPFIFSRWGGLGNHRYPIGFSGDTHVTWESLAYQPYFTATAANVNYGWWSHDIGGHMFGVEDRELYTRWVQFGVFSPIFRLHSTNNPFHERRPWGYDAQVLQVVGDAMRLRHQLIPYLYTMAWRNHQEGKPLVRPMYHEYANEEPAYHCPDQYLFGSELLISPFTSAADDDTRLSRQVLWLPPGGWFSFFDGVQYAGNGWLAVHGDLHDIPVFAKAGAIVPLAPATGWGGVANPESLEVHCFAGQDGSFDLYEDDDFESYSLTPISQEWSEDRWQLKLGPVQGSRDHLPQKRAIAFALRGVRFDVHLSAVLNGQPIDFRFEYDENSTSLCLSPVDLRPDDKLEITAVSQGGSLLAAEDYRLRQARKLIRALRMETSEKQKLDFHLPRLLTDPQGLDAFEFALTPGQWRALAEVIGDAGFHHQELRREASEAILLWNNTGSDFARYRMTAMDQLRQPEIHSGPLPRFAQLTLGQETMESHLLHNQAPGQVSVFDWFNTLVERSQALAPPNLEAVVQFNISGEHGRIAHLLMNKGQHTVAEGAHPRPDATFSANALTWLALINGQATPENLIADGGLAYSGDFNLIMNLAGIIRVTPANSYLADYWKLTVCYGDSLIYEP
jgi:alpha-glucosidase (family GH31 glycosyl hydrolase)/putative sterol carrier protein